MIAGLSVVVAGLISASSPNYVFYTVLRVFVGAANISTYICLFVYGKFICLCELPNCIWKARNGYSCGS